jgi:RNA polymerase sigma-70 factor (ECF subfamily)
MQSDEQLIDLYLKGEEHSLEILIDRYAGHIFNFIRQYINNSDQAEDLTQDTFVKVWRNIRKFDIKKSFRVWLFQIARNTTIDFLRKKKSILFSELVKDDGTEFDAVDESLNPEEILEKKSSEDVVAAALEKISDKYRSVISLYYREGFNFREISEIMDQPLDTIKSRHRRALRQLKKFL